jgi:hypothetical protein
MRFLPAAAAAALLLPPAAELPAQPTITKSEIRSAPPARTHRRLRDQVWQLFQQQDLRSGQAPQRALRRLLLPTRPRATEVPGLCRYDVLHVEFEPVRREDEGADTPVRAAGLRAQSQFRFLRPPADRHSAIADYRRLPSQGDCDGIDTDKVHFFVAEDEDVATDGYLAFLRLQEAVRAARPLPFECVPRQGESEADCRATVLAFTQDSIVDIKGCDMTSSAYCFRIIAEDLLITAFVGSSDGRVHSARAETMIVLAHDVID